MDIEVMSSPILLAYSTSPIHCGSGILRRLRDFAFEASLPTSQFCWLMPFVKTKIASALFFFRSSIIRDRHRSFSTLKWEVVGIEELRAATGVFEILGCGVLGVAPNLEAAFATVL